MALKAGGITMNFSDTLRMGQSLKEEKNIIAIIYFISTAILFIFNQIFFLTNKHFIISPIIKCLNYCLAGGRIERCAKWLVKNISKLLKLESLCNKFNEKCTEKPIFEISAEKHDEIIWVFQR